MRLFKKLLLGALVVVLTPFVLLGGWAAWEHVRDPLALIRSEVPSFDIAQDETYTVERAGEVRAYHDITLTADGHEPVLITVSLPSGQLARDLPVMILLGGFRSGRNSLKHVPRAGPNAVIAYEYPLREVIRGKGSPFARVAAARYSALAVPEQLVAIIRWARAQPWADPERINMLGYSLGAVFVPAAHHMAAANGLRLGPSIMAFGGARLKPILEANIRLKPAWLRPAIAWLAATLLRQLEPTIHLPYLKGEFLLINSLDDEMIPAVSVRALQRLTPEPKTIVILPGEHMDPRDPALMAEIVGITRSWLLARGAANPAS